MFAAPASWRHVTGGIGDPYRPSRREEALNRNAEIVSAPCQQRRRALPACATAALRSNARPLKLRLVLAADRLVSAFPPTGRQDKNPTTPSAPVSEQQRTPGQARSRTTIRTARTRRLALRVDRIRLERREAGRIVACAPRARGKSTDRSGLPTPQALEQLPDDASPRRRRTEVRLATPTS